MAANIIRSLPRSYKHPALNVRFQQTRSESGSSQAPPGPKSSTQQSKPLQQSSTPPQPPVAAQIITRESFGNTKLAVGVALGLSLSMFMKDAIIDRMFPKNEPLKPEKVQPSIDPKFMDHVISHDRKVNQLENQLTALREELYERGRQQQQSNQSSEKNQQRAGNGNVFELSEVIQANNMASEARHAKELEEQRKAMIREHLLKVEGEVLKVENKYRPTINKIRELEAHLENQRQIQRKEAPARLLWLSCQSLLNRLRDAPQRPLEKEPAYDVLKQFAANDNQLAVNILESLPPSVLKEGVQSEETLAERFRKLEKVCKRVALVDSHGAGLGTYLLSYLQSLFIIDRSKSISEEEIRGQRLVDPREWTTFDILARVRYCLGRGNLEQAVRYANQLKGQARVVARDWIRDARMHLATRQAFSALLAFAESIALDAAQGGNSNEANGSSTSFAS